MEKTNLAPKLPLELDEYGKFIYVSDSLVNARQKIKTILLTKPGEKIYDPEFGIGIYSYLFEPESGIITRKPETYGQRLQNNSLSIELFQNNLQDDLTLQLAKYCEDITLENLEISIENNVLQILIEYNYKEFVTDTITLVVGN